MGKVIMYELLYIGCIRGGVSVGPSEITGFGGEKVKVVYPVFVSWTEMGLICVLLYVGERVVERLGDFFGSMMARCSFLLLLRKQRTSCDFLAALLLFSARPLLIIDKQEVDEGTNSLAVGFNEVLLRLNKEVLFILLLVVVSGSSKDGGVDSEVSSQSNEGDGKFGNSPSKGGVFNKKSSSSSPKSAHNFCSPEIRFGSFGSATGISVGSVGVSVKLAGLTVPAFKAAIPGL